jgi:transglutaminase/protease-like cytokinesis protein 3
MLLLTGCAPERAESEYEGYVDSVEIVTDKAAEQKETPDQTEEIAGKGEASEGEVISTEEVSEQPQENDPSLEGVSEQMQEELSESAEENLTVDIREETAALAQSPAAVPEIVNTQPSGILEQRTEKAVIDYSHTEDGYVMVQYTAQTDRRIKTQVKGPSTTYTYNVTPGKWEVFPLSDNNGGYQVTVYENVTENKYAMVTSVSFHVQLKDEFAPFLLPNQYVDYANAQKTVVKAAELSGNEQDVLKKVELVYSFVVQELTYDTQKAATVKSGYLPVLDQVLAEKRGICFDYAALMAGMLRSQGVPCKLVVGYSGSAYHAWISVWSEETGWVDGAVFFDGASWQRMDPTFASSGKKSDSIMAYIGDGKNYVEKYLY